MKPENIGWYLYIYMYIVIPIFSWRSSPEHPRWEARSKMDSMLKNPQVACEEKTTPDAGEVLKKSPGKSFNSEYHGANGQKNTQNHILSSIQAIHFSFVKRFVSWDTQRPNLSFIKMTFYGSTIIGCLPNFFPASLLNAMMGKENVRYSYLGLKVPFSGASWKKTSGV